MRNPVRMVLRKEQVDLKSLGSQVSDQAGTELLDSGLQPIKIAKNTITLFAGQFSVFVGVAVMGIFIARTFGESGYGLYSLAVSFVGMFGLFFSLGTDAVVVREIAAKPANSWRVISSALWIRLISFPLTISVVLFGAAVARYAAEDLRFIAMMAIAFGLSVASDLPRAVFQGLQRMELDASNRVIEKVGALVLVVLLVSHFRNIEVVAWAAIIGSSGSLLVGCVVMPRLLGHPILSRPRQSVGMLRQAAPLAGSMIITAFYVQLPVVMLSWFYPLGEVGLYSAAYSIMGPFTLLPFALGGALLPALSGTLEARKEPLKRIQDKVIAPLLAVSIPLGVLINWLAESIVRIVYGEAFVPAAQALQILSVNLPVVFLSTYLAQLLIAAKEQSKLLRAVILNLALTTIIGFLVIPAFGSRGSAATLGMAHCGGIALMLYITSRWVQYRFDRRILAVVAAAFLLITGGWILRFESAFVRIPVALSLYVLALWLGGLLKIGQLVPQIEEAD